MTVARLVARLVAGRGKGLGAFSRQHDEKHGRFARQGDGRAADSGGGAGEVCGARQRVRGWL